MKGLGRSKTVFHIKAPFKGATFLLGASYHNMLNEILSL